MRSNSVSPSLPSSSTHRSDEQVTHTFARATGMSPAAGRTLSGHSSPRLPVIEGVEEFFASLSPISSLPRDGASMAGPSSSRPSTSRSDEQVIHPFAAIAERPSAIWSAPSGRREGGILAAPEPRRIEGTAEEGATEPQLDLPGTSGSGHPPAAIRPEGIKPKQTPRRITAEMLRLGQDWVGHGPGQMTLAQFADGAGVTKAALQNYLLADGSLTLRGEELRAGGVHGGRFQGVTAEIVSRAQAAVAGGQTLDAFAQSNKVSRRGLQNFVYADGSLTVDGKQLLGRAAQGGGARPTITPELVRRAQAAVRAGKTLETVALANKVFVRDLRNFVRADGTLTLAGAQRLAGGVQGGRLKGATAEIVRQAQAAIAAGQSLEEFAGANEISLNSLQKCLHSDGSLSIIGSQMLAGGVRGGHVQGVTPAIVMQAQAALAGGQSLRAFALANNVSFIDLKSAVRDDGSLTKRGAKMLGPERRQPD